MSFRLSGAVQANRDEPKSRVAASPYPAYVVSGRSLLQFRKHPTRGVNSIINVVRCVRPTKPASNADGARYTPSHPASGGRSSKAFSVARHHVTVAGYALSVGENPEHADMVNHQRNIRFFGSFHETFRRGGGEAHQRS